MRNSELMARNNIEKCCGRCRHIEYQEETDEWICTCPDSEYYTLEMEWYSTCFDYEGMEYHEE